MSVPDELDPKFVARLVGHIYEAAVDPRLWTDFVETIERIYPDSRVTLFGHENGRPESLTVMKNFPAEAMRDYVDYYVTNSPYVERAAFIPVGRPTRSESMVRDDELMKTEHYHDFVRPHRLGHYATGILLERAPGRMTAFSMADHTDDEARRERQMQLLDTIAPHFFRAVKLRRALIEQNSIASASQAVFDRWTHPALVLASSGRVLVMNAAATKLLRQERGLWLTREGFLRSFDEAKTKALEAAIAKCAAISESVSAPDGEDLAGVTLPRSTGGAALHVMVWSLPSLGARPEFGAVQGSVLVMISDPDDVHRVPVRWLARQSGLSPSEERLLAEIVNGVTLADAAEQLGIRVSTAQTRLKVIQTKTGCRRQVDLVRLAMSMPAMRRD